jgi:predicted RNA-binding protein with PUA-like domain
MATFLFKTEPGEFSFADLQRDGRALWTGVSNASALIHLRSCAPGDEVLIYHTGDQKAVVGLARVAGPVQHDPDQPEARTPTGSPKHACVPIEALRAAPSPVTLAQIKADARFADFALVRLSRLSVMPVPAELDIALRALAGLNGPRPSAPAHAARRAAHPATKKRRSS